MCVCVKEIQYAHTCVCVCVCVCAQIARVFLSAAGILRFSSQTWYHEDENVVCADRTNHEDT